MWIGWKRQKKPLRVWFNNIVFKYTNIYSSFPHQEKSPSRLPPPNVASPPLDNNFYAATQ